MKKIMVVDDDKDLLVTMKAFISKLGYSVVVSTSCGEGLDMLDWFGPDLIFLDINIGEEDGREMCQKIKSIGQYQHIPVVLISGNHEALQQYRTCRANSVIYKPFRLSTIGAEIGHY